MNIIRQILLSTAISAAGVVIVPAVAQPTQASTGDMADGEVRKIDKAGGKLTLKHGEIKNLDMPGMTMVFTVKDKAVLDTLQPGDKVRFKVINDRGTFTVTEIEPAK